MRGLAFVQQGGEALAMWWEWEDAGSGVVEAARASVQERMQKEVAEGEERVFGGPLVR